jgi:hypothetical protein
VTVQPCDEHWEQVIDELVRRGHQDEISENGIVAAERGTKDPIIWCFLHLTHKVLATKASEDPLVTAARSVTASFCPACESSGDWLNEVITLYEESRNAHH